MYCPQCGIESTDKQRFCRSCGANLSVIGKALSLGDAISHSENGPLLKLKELMDNPKIRQMTDDVTRAFDHVKQELVKSAGPSAKAQQRVARAEPEARRQDEPWWLKHEQEKRSPQRRSENHLVKGTVSLFTGVGLMIFWYYFASAIVLKIPPEALAKIPFELGLVIQRLWLVGLIPVFSGTGRILAGLMIRAGAPAPQIQPVPLASALPYMQEPADAAGPVAQPDRVQAPASIAEGTTELLDHDMDVHSDQVS